MLHELIAGQLRYEKDHTAWPIVYKWRAWFNNWYGRYHVAATPFLRYQGDIRANPGREMGELIPVIQRPVFRDAACCGMST